jgi:hypothetical protein
VRDNTKDRAIGAHWERQFGVMAASFGLLFTPHQLPLASKSAAAYGRKSGEWEACLLPDITIWSAPGEHHEIKHKNPTRHGSYGLERYRLDALLRFAGETQTAVLYTIHDWQRAGAASSDERTPNRVSDWLTANVAELAERVGFVGQHMQSYRNGRMSDAEICYWPVAAFGPLIAWWASRMWAGASSSPTRTAGAA